MTSDDDSDESIQIAVRTERDFYPKRWSALLSAGINGGLAGFSALLAVLLLGRGDPLGYVAGVNALWMVWATRAWYRRWRTHGPSIAMTADGILDGTGLGAPTFIPWADIASVSGDSAGTELLLREDSTVRTPFHRRFLGWLTRRSRSQYFIPTRGLETHHFAVEAYLREWHESLLLDSVVDRKGSLASGDTPPTPPAIE